MASMGDLVVNLRANSQDLTHGMGEASHAMHSFKHAALEVAGAMGIGLGIEKTVESIHGQIEAVAGLAHESEKLDIPVNALIALQHEAKMAHVEFSSLETGMERMQRNLAEAAAGSSKQGAAFRTLGLDIEKIIDLPADKQFAMVADSISHMGNATDRARAAMGIFGRGGMDLMNILKQGSAGMARAADETDRLGLSVSHVDAEKMVEADRALKEMGESVSGMVRSFAIELAPSIKQAADELTRFADQKKKLAQPGGKDTSGLDVAGWASQWTASSFQKLVGSTMNLAGGAGLLGQNFMTAGGNALVQAGDERWRNIKEQFSGVQLEAEKATEHIKEAGAALDATGRKGGESLALATAKAEAFAKAMEIDEKAAAGLFNSMQTSTEKAMQQWEEARNLFDRGLLDEETMTRTFEKMVAEINKLRDKELKPLKDAFKDMSDEAGRIFEDTRTPMEKFQEQTEKLFDLFNAGFLDDDTFARALEQEQDRLDKAMGVDAKPASHVSQRFEVGQASSQRELNDLIAATNKKNADPALAVHKQVLGTLQQMNKKMQPAQSPTVFNLGPGGTP